VGQHPLHLERLLDLPERQELGRQPHHAGPPLRPDQPHHARRRLPADPHRQRRRPAARWARLIGIPAHRYADRIAPLGEAFGAAAEALFAALQAAPDDTALCALLNDFFLRRLEASEPPPRLLVEAHALLLDPEITTAQQFADRLGLSSRQMARLSLDMFGFPPKLLLRRQRFLRTLARLRANPDEPWLRLLDEAYYDQSHFVRDFRHFMGRSPTQYFSGTRALLDPAAPLRQQAIGEPLQGLHPVTTIKPR
jgi:AraC-like DNA-binding protein